MAWPERLMATLPAYGYIPDAAALQRLSAYLAALVRWDRRAVRLIGGARPDMLVKRHLGESLYLGKILALDRQHILDIGSGNGFPGLALALAYPGIKTTLVESHGKKATFLRHVIENTGIRSRTTVMQMRIDATCKPDTASCLGRVDVVTCRGMEAMAEAPNIIEACLPAGTTSAFWVTRSQADAWESAQLHWRWQPRVLLPGASDRAILIGQWM